MMEARRRNGRSLVAGWSATLRKWAKVALFALCAAPAALGGTLQGYRGNVLDFVDDPSINANNTRYYEDGMLLVRDGKVVAVGNYSDMFNQYHPDNVTYYRDMLITPGFIDTHIHYPQMEMVASYGEQLLQWLNTYTFPTEKKYSDYTYAKQQADSFINELLKNGTTTALVFGTVSKASVDAFFTSAQEKNLRMIAGKVMMDRNAPDYLLDTPQSAYDDSKALIQKWHNNGRLGYAITPRFAPTSTRDELAKAGQLKAEFPSVWVHTHLSENLNEIAWVKDLFPERSGYLDVYNYYGLTGPRSVFAHGVHLEDGEWQTMASTGSALSHCPTSNLFLGSGLFDLKKAHQYGVKVGLGTDIGAGTSFSALQTLDEAYKVQQLQGYKLSAFEGLYLATLGSAKALDLQDKIGNFNAGKEADFVVLDPRATALLKQRVDRSTSTHDKLFALMTLGDDRSVLATYSFGNRVYASPAAYNY
jgi:guanine deaminase